MPPLPRLAPPHRLIPAWRFQNTLELGRRNPERESCSGESTSLPAALRDFVMLCVGGRPHWSLCSLKLT